MAFAECAGQQLEKAALGSSPADSADVRGPHATLAVKLQVRLQCHSWHVPFGWKRLPSLRLLRSYLTAERS